ncbi:MAG: hypothetical protein RL141_1056 [Candidatus Parcubacteria bacterium]|jgi:hypothetical protein
MPRDEWAPKAENVKDPEAAKEVALDEFRKRGAELTEEERDQLVCRVLEHSIEDGLEVAEYFGTDREALLEGFEGSIFISKHPEFALQLGRSIKENVPHADKEDAEYMNDCCGAFFSEDARETLQYASSIDAWSIRGSSVLGKRLVREIDQAYAPFLSVREVREEGGGLEQHTDSRGERLAYANLEQAELALRSRYYAGAVRDILEKAGHDRPLPPTVEEMLQRKSYLTEGEVFDVCTRAGVDIARPDIEHQVKQARYMPLDVIYRTGNKIAQDTLKAEIRASLHARGMDAEIVKDDAAHTYSIRSVHRDAESKEHVDRPFDLERLSRKEIEIPEGCHVFKFDEYGVFFMVQEDIDSYYIGSVDGFRSAENYTRVGIPSNIRGGVAFAATKGTDHFIVYPDGSKSKAYGFVGRPIGVDGGVVFAATEKSKNGYFINYPDGSKSETYQWAGNPLNIEGKAAFSARENDQSFIVYPDGSVSQEYDQIWGAANVGDRVAFVAAERGKGGCFLVYPDGSRSKPYPGGGLGHLQDMNGGVLFTAKDKDDGDMFIVYPDGSRSQGHYDHIYEIANFDGNVAVVTEEEDGMLILYPDGSKSEKYDQIEAFYVENKKIYCTARRGKKIIHYEGSIDQLRGGRDPQKKELEVDMEEKLKLGLLQLLEWPDAADGFALKVIMQGQQERERATLSADASRVVNDMLREIPETLLDTIAAKRDVGSVELANRVVDRLFPSVPKNRRRKQEGLFGWKRWGRRGGEDVMSLEAARQAALDPGMTEEMRDGDPAAKEGKEILKLRQPISEMLVTGVHAAYNKHTGAWERNVFPIAPPEGRVKEVTAEISVTSGQERIVLPLAAGAIVLKERVKGVTEAGEEVIVEMRVDAGGGAIVEIPKGVVRILYSQSIPEALIAPHALSIKAYDAFRHDMVRRFGDAASERLPGLPEEEKLFLRSIQKHPPLERAIAIQRRVLECGHYDFANKEVQAQKRGGSFADIFGLMRQRMVELRKRDTKNEMLKGKKYAGVCADFAKLTTAMMRESGLLSGVLAGLQPMPGETSVTTEQMHAASFLLWPAENGNMSIIPVDATPTGASEKENALLRHIHTSSLEERMEQTANVSATEGVGAEERLAELERTIAHLDAAAVREMNNGELERTLNGILASVRHSHVAALERALSAARYAGIDVPAAAEGTNPEAKLAALRLLEDEIAKERVSSEEGDQGRRGAALMRLVTDYAGRYAKDHPTNTGSGIDAVDHILSLAKNALDPVERRAVAAVVTYLRAQYMLGSAKKR